VEEQKKYDRKATRSGVVYITTNLLVASSNLFLIPIYTSILSKNEYGLYSLFVSLTSLFIPIISLAGDAAITRYYFSYKSKNAENPYLSTISFFLLANNLIVGILVFFFADYVIGYLEIKIISSYHILLAFVAAFGLVWSKSHLRILKAIQDTRKTPVFNILRIIFQASISLSLLFLWGLQELSLISGYAAAACLFGMIGLYSYVRRYPPHFQKREFTELCNFVLPLVPNRFSAYAVIPIQNFIVAALGNTGLLGIYSVAGVFGSAFTLILQNISDAMQPWLFKNFSNKDSDRTINEAIYNSTLCIFIFLMIGAGVVLLIVPHIVGTEFKEVAAYIPVLMLFSFANFYKNIALSILMYFPGGTKKVSIATYAHLIMILLFTWLTIGPFELWGVVWSLALSRYISSEISVYFAENMLGDSRLVDWKKIRILLYILTVTFAIGSALLIERPVVYALLCFSIALSIATFEYSRLKEVATYLMINISRRSKSNKC
jgi:O-antigen/teichoic acid export membrane protein